MKITSAFLGITVVALLGFGLAAAPTTAQEAKIQTIVQTVPPGTCVGYVGLTFDDGPDPSSTPLILAILKEKQSIATFFNIGTHTRTYPALVKAEAKAGMTIGDHSWDHPHLTRMSQAGIKNELNSTADLDQQLTGVRPTFYRPPFEDTSIYVRNATKSTRMTETLWNVDTKDWLPTSTLYSILGTVSSIQNGDVILMHDGNYPATIASLPFLLDALRAKGLCTGELAKLPRPTKLDDETPMYVTAVAPRVLPEGTK